VSLLTIAQAQALGAGIGLSDSDLQVVIDREEAELVRRFGANYAALTPVVETAHGGGRSIYLKRQVTSVTSIVECLYLGDTSPTTLTATDYYVWGQEGRIERVPYGTTAACRWGRVCTVTYTPVDDSDLRRMVLVELIRIATEQTTAGGGGVSGLGFSISDSGSSGWSRQREAQYARLGWLSR
jgi:hypothetical protein